MQESKSFTDSNEMNIKRKGPSKMAAIVALLRADESRKPEDERICYDPYAIRFVSPEVMEFAARNPERYKAEMGKQDRLMPGLVNSLVARVRYFDDVVNSSVDNGLEQLVILGAGYDTRAYRIEGLKKARVFEVDHPDTMSVKVGKIKEIFGSLPDHVTYVPIDLEVDKLGQQLAESGYDRTRKTLFVMEGLVYYLSPEAVDELLSFIVHNTGRGSAVLFDYGRTRPDRAKNSDTNASNFVKEQGEPIKFFVNGSIEAFLTERGFSKIKNMDSQDYKKTYFQGKNANREVYDLSSFAYAVVE